MANNNSIKIRKYPKIWTVDLIFYIETEDLIYYLHNLFDNHD